MATMITDEDIFVLIPFKNFLGEEGAETEKWATFQVELENVDSCAFVKEKQNIKEESVVAEAPAPWLEPLIDNLDVNNKDSLHLGKSLPRRNQIQRLLKLIETNPHVHLKYSTKMLQLGDAFSGSTQLSSKVNLVTFF